MEECDCDNCGRGGGARADVGRRMGEEEMKTHGVNGAEKAERAKKGEKKMANKETEANREQEANGGNATKRGRLRQRR